MDPVVYSFITIQLLIVSWVDLRRKVISNYWHLLNVVAAVLLYTLLPGQYELKWQALLFPVGYLLFGFGLFLAGIMGAGDSKYLASLCLLLPLQEHVHFFEALLTCTVIVGAMLLLVRLWRDRQRFKAYAWSRYWKGMRELIKSEFSYAPVIFLAWIFLGIEIWL